MGHQVLDMPGVQDQVLPMFSGNGTGGTRVDSPAPSSFENGASRPPTPHGTGLPDNFGEVVAGIYRSSYPQLVHRTSIAGLNLKTVITLVKEPLSVEYERMMEDNGISYHVIPIIPNKTPGVSTPQSTIDEVLKILLEPKNHPVLVHCNKGKHRTGCVMACFRLAQGWHADTAIAEYFRYAHPKPRPLDQAFIKTYNPTVLADIVEESGARNWKPSFLNLGVVNAITINGDNSEGVKSQDDLLPTVASPSVLAESFHTNKSI